METRPYMRARQGVAEVLWVLGERQLLKAYPDEGSAVWAYTKALWTFRRKGAGAGATRALKAALRTNPHVPFYLFGLRELPEELPGYIGMGDESEAVSYVAEAITSWIDTAGALDWFAGSMDRLATQATARPQRR